MAQTHRKQPLNPPTKTKSGLRPSEPKVPISEQVKEGLLAAFQQLFSTPQAPPQVTAVRALPQHMSLPATQRVKPPPTKAESNRVFLDHAMQAFIERDLTPAEIKMAMHVLQGQSNAQIALTEEVSEKTVKAHIGSVFRKFGVDSRAQLSARIFPI